MQYLAKHKFIFLALALLLVVYFVTRLITLTSLPIFTDEAIYVRWAQIAHDDAAWRFISLTDGKQPSYIWGAILSLELFKDPLFAGRMVSVIAGFFSVVGLFFSGREIFRNTKIGLLAAGLYVIYPFAMVYDRLAIYDSLVFMFMTWALYFTVLLIRHIRLDIAMILGMIIGGGMLTKSSANFAFILLPFSLLLFPFKKKIDKRKIGLWAVFATTAFILAQVMYSVLRLSPFYHIIGQKNLTFIYSFSDWFQSPFAFVWGNLDGLTTWLIGYVSIPFLLLAFASFVIKREFTREKLLLIIWFIVPFMALAFFGKVIYPRFIFFMTMPLILLGSFGLYYLMNYVKKLWIKIIILLVFTISWLYSSYFVITDFGNAPIPNSDKAQLYAAWPAGGGVIETIAFLEKEAAKEPIFVGTQGTFGLMPYALEIYLAKNPNIKIQGYWPIEDNPPQELLDASKEKPTYIVFYQPCSSCGGTGIAPASWNLEKIYQIEKDEKGAFYTLYQVKPLEE